MNDVPPETPTQYEQFIEQQLTDCGLEEDNFSIGFQDYLQGIEIVLLSNAEVKPHQFDCIYNATKKEVVTFQDQKLANSYSEFQSEKIRPQMLEENRQKLQEVGLLKGFPSRKDFSSLQDYAIALELHLGFMPGGVLSAQNDAITIQPLKDEQNALSNKQRNLLTAVLFAWARDQVKFGFVGNESSPVKPHGGE